MCCSLLYCTGGNALPCFLLVWAVAQEPCGSQPLAPNSKHIELSPLLPAGCRYVGVTERDYEWLTDQIVQVANR